MTPLRFMLASTVVSIIVIGVVCYDAAQPLPSPARSLPKSVTRTIALPDANGCYVADPNLIIYCVYEPIVTKNGDMWIIRFKP